MTMNIYVYKKLKVEYKKSEIKKKSKFRFSLYVGFPAWRFSRIVRAISTFTRCSYLLLPWSRHDSLLRSHSKTRSGDSMDDGNRQVPFCTESLPPKYLSHLFVWRALMFGSYKIIYGARRRNNSHLDWPSRVFASSPVRFIIGRDCSATSPA